MQTSRRPRAPPAAFCGPVLACVRPSARAAGVDREPRPRSAAVSRRAALRLFAVAVAAAAAGPVAAEEEEEKGKGYSVEELEELAEWRAHAGDEVPVWSETVVPEKDVGDNAKVLAMRAGVLGFVASFSAFGSAYSDRESGRAALPRRYDPAAVARYFAIRPDKVLYRLFQLVAEAARLSALSASHKVAEVLLDVQRLPQKYRDERKEQRTQQHAAALRDAAARLGPAAVKLAQAAATRPDIFGSELARELQTLHDAVAAPFPVGEAFHLMKQQIGASPHAVFDEIDEKPVANASLGMVFRGVLDGKPVAIKVQRPGVTESIALDFYIVRSCAGFLQRFFKIRTEMRQAVDDYASRMFEELDYRTEVDNMAKFESMYGEVPGICIPKAYKLYTTRKVLVTDWVTGRKIIDDESNVRVEELGVVETGIKFALTQLLDKGYLHADMHNGNMLATPSGKLAYIDFGICSEIPPRVRQSMVVALFYLIHGEYEALADAFVGLALMRPDDMDIELDRFAAALQEAFEYTGEGDPNNGAVCDPHSPVQCQFSLVGVAENLVALSGKFPLVLSPYFIDNLRCLGMLEGLALNADPNFSVLNVLYPFIMRKILAGGPDSMYREALQRVLVNGDGVLDWTKLDAMLNEVQRSERAGVLTAPYATKKKARNVHEPLDDLLLSSKGSFLRSQIMKEWGLPAEKTRYSRTPKAGEVFMGASIGGKLRAVLLFLPVLIMRSVLRAFLGGFAFFFGRRRRKNMVSSDNSKAAGGDSSGEAGLE